MDFLIDVLALALLYVAFSCFSGAEQVDIPPGSDEHPAFTVFVLVVAGALIAAVALHLLGWT